MIAARRLAPAAAALVLLLGSCGSEDEATGASSDCRTAEQAAEASAPSLTTPAAPVTELEVSDLSIGCGLAIDGNAVVDVEVNYVGRSQANGVDFDSSFERGQTITFPVGDGSVIPGWDQGLVGMKEGGRRVLLIPGSLGYGAQGNPPDIAPDDTLLFVVDLISVTEPA